MSESVHFATLARREPLAREVVAYRFHLAAGEEGLWWRGGQFLSLACGVDAGEPVLRSYSIASRPGAGDLLLVVKLLADGFGSNWFRRLEVGTRIRFTGPFGFFYLDPRHNGDLVFAATGTGIAPMLPMIDELLDRGDGAAIHLFWGLRDEEDRFWSAELEERVARSRGRLTVRLCLSRPRHGLGQRLVAPLLALAPALQRPVFYLCGNGAMIRELKGALVAQGVDRRRQIRSEAFCD